jgi:hypothetical protein
MDYFAVVGAEDNLSVGMGIATNAARGERAALDLSESDVIRLALILW